MAGKRDWNEVTSQELEEKDKKTGHETEGKTRQEREEMAGKRIQ